MSRNLCTRATPAGRAPGIRTVAGQRVTAQSTRTGRSGGTRPAGHSPGGRRVATTGSWQKSERVKKDCSTCCELGPMTVEDLAQRHTGGSEEVASYLENLLAVKRIFPAMISGREHVLPVWMMPPGCVMPSACATTRVIARDLFT